MRAATTVVDPPTRSNLIAMAAPVGNGVCSFEQLEQILGTAYTGFAAAVDQSASLWPGAVVEVNTGFWGCGAYGGDRTVMVHLQLLAARLAGVARLRFHTVDQAGVLDFETGAAPYPEDPVAELLSSMAERRFPWGTSDGN